MVLVFHLESAKFRFICPLGDKVIRRNIRRGQNKFSVGVDEGCLRVVKSGVLPVSLLLQREEKKKCILLLQAINNRDPRLSVHWITAGENQATRYDEAG